MFEKFTEQGIKVIMLAQEEARRLGHNFVGTEQLLLGLIHEGTGIAAKSLKATGVSLKDARVEVEKIIGRGSGFLSVEIPFTPRAKRVIEHAWAESRQLGTDYISTEHLLLGLIHEGDGVAARVLENLGINLDKLRTKVIESLPDDKSGQPKKNSTTELIGNIVASAPGRGIINQYKSASTVTPSLVDSIIRMLSPEAQQLAKELIEIVGNKASAISNEEFDKAATLRSQQMEITEKLRLLIEQKS